MKRILLTGLALVLCVSLSAQRTGVREEVLSSWNKSSGLDCVFAATHLDHVSTAAALEQMRQINDWFTVVYSGYAKPVFLCGDFNVLPDSEVIALAKECWTPLSGTEVTFS